MTRRQTWLVCYDVASPRRLGRVRRWLVRHAVPAQYSVFVATGTKADIDALVHGLAKRIDPRRDDVRLYPLERGRPAHRLGIPLLAAGINAEMPAMPSPGGCAPRRGRAP